MHAVVIHVCIQKILLASCLSIFDLQIVHFQLLRNTTQHIALPTIYVRILHLAE